jgi:hypothetical protein
MTSGGPNHVVTQSYGHGCHVALKHSSLNSKLSSHCWASNAAGSEDKTRNEGKRGDEKRRRLLGSTNSL